MSKLKISIVVPVYCEEENLTEFFERLLHVINDRIYKDLAFEIIINDNASSDNSWHIICKFASNNNFIRAHKFARNYGFQNSILYGISVSKGDAVVILQSDLQEPPEVIREILNTWLIKRCRIVLAVPSKRDENILFSLLRNLFYYIFFKVSDLKNIKHAQDFYLIDKSVSQELMTHPYSNQFLRGSIIKQFSDNDIIINYLKKKRIKGKSSFNFIKLYALAMDAFLAYGSKILRVLTLTSILFLFVLTIGIVIVLIMWLFGARFPVSGYTSILIILMFIAIITLLSFSIIIEYLYRIYSLNFSPTSIVIQDKIK